MLDLNRRLFLAGAAGTALASQARATSLAAPAGSPVPSNPVVPQRADAQVFRHTDGSYYMTASVPEYDRLVLRRSPTLAGLATAQEKVLWRHLASGPMSGFNAATLDAEFFPDGRWRSNFLMNIGYGADEQLFPRNPRLAFDEACLVL